jgi:hypothetical protein
VRSRLQGADQEVDLPEHAVQVQVEARQPVARAEPEARGQHADASLAVDRHQVGGVPAGAVSVECGEERQRPFRLVQPGERRDSLERRGHFGQTTAGEERRADVGNLDRICPHRLVRLQVVASDHPAAVADELEQGFGDRSPVDARGALLGDQLERPDEPRLLQPLFRPEQPSGGCVNPSAFAHRHHRLEHRQAGDVRRGHWDALVCEPQRRGAKLGPWEAAVGAPERVQPRRDARHCARGSADRVVDELLAERHVELDERCSRPARHGTEAVEVAHRARAGVVVDRVSSAEKAGHHRLGDARGETGGNGGVRSRAAGLEDLDSGGRGGRMAGCDGCRKHPC